MTKQLTIEEKRKKIEQLSKKARKLNSDFQSKISYYRQKGYDIEGEYKVAKTQQEINNILNKMKYHNAKQVDNDLERMRDFSRVSWYDYVKFNDVKYEDVRRGEKKVTSKLKKVLEQAKELYPENIKTNEYTPQLQSLIMDLKNEPEVADAEDVSDFYSISPEYNPKKEEELFRNIDIKTLPYTEDIENITEALSQKLHDEQVRVQLLKEDIANKSYNSNVKSINNLDVYTMYTLENVMNSSAAWHICKSYDDDSDQTKANWEELYNYTRLALDTDFELFDKVVTMIENEASLDNIINYIDHEIYDMM